jgi:DNA-binding response OmpR family regulator
MESISFANLYSEREMHSPMKSPVEDSKPTLLVLDDDVLSLELYSRELSSNYRVITCERVEDARKHFKDESLFAVILEPAINGEDGWRLLKEIRASAKPLAVIVCSILDERKCGLEQGADVFLIKPVLPSTLHHLIDQFVSKRTAQSENGSAAQQMEKGT